MHLPETRFVTSTKTGLFDTSKTTVVVYGSTPIDRMKSYGCKSFIPISKTENIIDIQLSAIRSVFPKSEIIFVGGFDFESLIKNKTNEFKVIENSRFESSNEIEDIKIAINAMTNTQLVTISSDIIMNSNTLLQIKGRGSSILVDRRGQFSPEDIGSTWINNKLEMLSFGIPNQWCHISQFHGKEFDLLKKFVNSNGKDNMMLFEGINYILRNGGKMLAIGQTTGFCRKIEKVEDINAGNY